VAASPYVPAASAPFARGGRKDTTSERGSALKSGYAVESASDLDHMPHSANKPPKHQARATRSIEALGQQRKSVAASEMQIQRPEVHNTRATLPYVA
jgi:hypothetical protein